MEGYLKKVGKPGRLVTATNKSCLNLYKTKCTLGCF